MLHKASGGSSRPDGCGADGVATHGRCKLAIAQTGFTGGATIGSAPPSTTGAAIRPDKSAKMLHEIAVAIVFVHVDAP